MSLNSDMKDILTAALQVFVTDYPGTIDEFVVVNWNSIGSNKPFSPYCVVPPRNESEGYEYAEDAKRIVTELQNSNKAPSQMRIFSVPDARGTHFDAVVLFSFGYTLLINAKDKTYQELQDDVNWPGIETELKRLIKRLNDAIYQA